MNTNKPEHSQPAPAEGGTAPKRKKRWWEITKAVLGHLLPFLIVGGLVAGIYFLIFHESESESELLDDREKALEENWEKYLDQAEGANRNIQLDRFELTLCPFAEDDTNWNKSVSPEEAGMICGNVTVPLYHQDPEGETIQIPVVVWPTLEETETPDPLFIMQGGPGGSTLDLYPNRFFGSRPGGEREIVFADQRGTRYADPSLICSEADEPEEEEEDDKEEEDGLSEEEREEKGDVEYLTYLTTCHDRLVSEGVDLNAFNTAEIAHDMEFIRKVLDYQAINFYGVSYGSHIGQYLAAYHPEGLRSLILDGVAPIPLNYLDKTFAHANRLLEDYLVECEGDSACSGFYPDLSDRINALIDQLDETPDSVTLHDPNSRDSVQEDITGENYLYFLIYLFRMDSSYATLPFLVEQAEESRYDLYQWLGEMLTFEETNSDGLYFAVVGGEHTPFTPPSENEYLIPKLKEIELESYTDNLAEFEVWNVTASTETLSSMPESAVPALLMSGYYDPATPPSYAEKTLKSFPNGQHVIDPVGGHGIAFNDDCTEGILATFLADPEIPVSSACLAEEARSYDLVPPNFISAPFLIKMIENEDYFYLSWLIPPVVFLVMIFRGAWLHLAGLWRKNRGKAVLAKARENLIHLRFELSAWVFMITCLTYLLYLNIVIFSLFDTSAYLNAMAFPSRYRGVLFMAMILAVITLIMDASAIELWMYRKKVLARTYLLLQVVFSGFLVAYLIWSDLVLAWVG